MEWIGEVVASDRVIAKIADRHGVEFWEIREAVLGGPHLGQRWVDQHDGKGPRLMVRSETYAGRRLLVVLFPLPSADGTWAVATAYDEEL